MPLASLLPASAKTALRDLSNRVRFPRANLGSGSYVQRHVSLARGTAVGNGCALMRNCQLLKQVRLGDHVVVGRGARIAQSQIGERTTVEPEAELYQVTLGSNVSVQTRTILTEANVGRFTYLGRESYLNFVEVGSFSSIGPHALAGLGEHPSDFATTSPAFYSLRKQCGATFAKRDHFAERRPILIGSDVWIGARVFIRDGVSIGDGAIIAAGAVVVRDVEPYSIVGGTPAQLIRMRFSAPLIARLVALRWWQWPDERLARAQPYLASPAVERFLDWAESSEARAPIPAH